MMILEWRNVETNGAITFSEMRSLLLKPTKEGALEREISASFAAACKGYWGSMEMLLGTVAMISTIATVRSNAFAFLAIASILGTLWSHEAHVISKNIEELLDSPFLTRAHAALSPENLTHACLKGTLVGERFFGSTSAKLLART